MFDLVGRADGGGWRTRASRSSPHAVDIYIRKLSRDWKCSAT